MILQFHCCIYSRWLRSKFRGADGKPTKERSQKTWDLVRKAETSLGATQRELKQLTDTGIIRRIRRANQVYYQANPDNPIFRERKSILTKTVGVHGVLKNQEGVATTGGSHLIGVCLRRWLVGDSFSVNNPALHRGPGITERSQSGQS
jgi:hypothetical protein